MHIQVFERQQSFLIVFVQAKPLSKLSDFAPSSSVFDGPVLCSVFGQFIVHFASLFAVLHLCQSEYAVPEASAAISDSRWTQVIKPIADSRFTPNVVNSASVFAFWHNQHE